MEEHCSYHPNQVAVCRRERIFVSDPPEVFLCEECLKKYKFSGFSHDYKTYPLDEINIDMRKERE